MRISTFLFFFSVFFIAVGLMLWFSFCSRYIIIRYMSLELFLIFILSLFVLLIIFFFSIKLQFFILLLLVMIAIETALGLSLLIKYFRIFLLFQKGK